MDDIILGMMDSDTMSLEFSEKIFFKIACLIS